MHPSVRNPGVCETTGHFHRDIGYVDLKQDAKFSDMFSAAALQATDTFLTTF